MINPVQNIKLVAGKVNFTSKDKKNDIQIPHPASSLKAVPFAVLLAMSPLNAINVNAEDKVVLQGQYESATNTNTVCNIDFISIDGDDNNAEELFLKFPFVQIRKVKDESGKYIDAKNVSEFALSPETLTTVDYVAERGDYKSKLTGYFVSGKGYEYYAPMRSADTGKEIFGSKASYKETSVRVEISKEFYDYLKGMYGENGIKYENAVVDVLK